MNLKIGYLYGDLMNIYGDTGNITALSKRAEWRNISTRVDIVSINTQIKKGDFDIFFFGGGQDQSQIAVSEDLLNSSKNEVIKSEVERGVPILSICGGYQLLGEYYQPFDADRLPGINIFKAYTEASNDRMIGNIVIELTARLKANELTSQLLVGFENHSGKTHLTEGAIPLGKVIKGFGNNGADKTEGCVYKNAIGCYMHGSLLPKNPILTDWLLKKALEVKYEKDINLGILNDKIESEAHENAVKMFS